MTGPIVSTILIVVHYAVVAGFSVHVIMRRAPIGVSLAWLAVLFSVPYAGPVIYLLFGVKRLGRRRFARITAGASRLES